MDDQQQPAPTGISLVWVIVTVVVLVILLLVGIVVYNNHNAAQTGDQSVAPGAVSLNSSQTTPTAQPSVTADQANQTDLQSIDNNLKTFDANGTQADAGLNDQQGDLSE